MTRASTLEYHPWSTFMAARQEARRVGDHQIGTDHLLLGLLLQPEIESLLGVSLSDARAALSTLDLNALRAFGFENIPSTPELIDQPIPPRPSMKVVMGSHMKMSPAAKRALQDAGRPMRRGHHIRAKDVLAALLENDVPDPAAELLDALGVNRPALRLRLENETAPH